MMKHSAGVLAYRYKDNSLEVFLEHMGGPYWQNKNIGAWSIPKGEYDNEPALNAAKREFEEESGINIDEKELDFLMSLKLSNKKLGTFFMVEADFDASNIKSNTFIKEWPPKSGIMKEFPEMDKGAWIKITDAKELILKNQIPILNRLESIKKISE